jgi:thiosulfate/3-mercaptopyruvate sulfurtransferase
VRYYLDGRSAHEAFDRGHLPGAVFVDMDTWLSTKGAPADGRHPLPTPETFAEGMGRIGVSDTTPVVAYDDSGGTTAARLVWMLRSLGHPAALLDGGMLAYDGPLSTDEAVRQPGSFTPRPWPGDRLATIDDASDPTRIVIDARDAARYRGETEPIDPIAGHIPGARNLPCRANVDDDGRFATPEALRARFAEAGITDGSTVVSYCGSGVTACHNLLALERAGLGQGRLYPGSWSQYSNTPDRDIAVGDEP